MATKSQSPRLGRGLAALLGDAGEAAPHVADRSLRMLPIAQLTTNPFQPRENFDPSELTSLAESIKSSGLLQPILVRATPDHVDLWQIIAGERRWRAAQMAGLHEVPCLVRLLSDSEAAAAALIENLQRQDLNAIEEAQAYRKLIDGFGLTQDEVGQAVGRSRTHITNTLRLLNLPKQVQNEVTAGRLSAGHARALVGREDAVAASRRIIDGQLNVRQAEKLPKRQPKGTQAPEPPPPDVADLAHRLSMHLGVSVEIKPKREGAWLVLKCSDLDQVDRLVSHLLED